jgi:hypothetical protein
VKPLRGFGSGVGARFSIDMVPLMGNLSCRSDSSVPYLGNLSLLELATPEENSKNRNLQ